MLAQSPLLALSASDVIRLAAARLRDQLSEDDLRTELIAHVARTRPWAKLPKHQRPALLPEGLRFYDLRHTCASLLIAQGASVKAVQAQFGHATASITLDTYGHLFPSEMEALADWLELVRDAAVARRSRTQRGPTEDDVGKSAGR
jgi:integrase